MAKITGPTSRGKKKTPYVKINGVVYFYSGGFGRTSHLARGIWAKSGTHGIVLKPVLLFVKRTVYRRYFNIERYAADVPREFEVNFAKAFAQAMATAK